MIEVKATPAAPAANPFGDEEEEEAPVTEAPTKRAAPKRATVDTATAKPEVKQVMASWLDDEDEDGE
jgi:hypothetical protein